MTTPARLPFAASERSSVGIEWELALVDADSGDLRQVASTVLDAVRALAPNLTGGCEEGFCGRCQVTVLDGVPDHRDALLSAAQRKRGCMLACVSRAKSDCLTLDV